MDVEKRRILNCTVYNFIFDHSYQNPTRKNGFGLFAEKENPELLLLLSSRQEYFSLYCHLYYCKLSCKLGLYLNRVRWTLLQRANQRVKEWEQSEAVKTMRKKLLSRVCRCCHNRSIANLLAYTKEESWDKNWIINVVTTFECHDLTPVSN